MIDWMLCPSWVPVKAVKINPISSSSGGFFNMPHTYAVGDFCFEGHFGGPIDSGL